MKIYSIKEIVEATNNLLHPKTSIKNNEKTNEPNLKSKRENKDTEMNPKEFHKNTNMIEIDIYVFYYSYVLCRNIYT